MFPTFARGGAPVNSPGSTGPVPMPVGALTDGDSPRLAGVDPAHVERLLRSPGPWPPILVQRRTMRIIDGMHRLAAARLRGDEDIDAILCDEADDAAFVLAVRVNVRHGLPLGLDDRKRAARRIARENPTWSDRMISRTTGLSAKLVGQLRGDATPPGAAPVRVGQDGRRRPLSGADGRRRAGALLTERPGASLREIARAAGVSTGTVRDVRDRLRRGEDPVPAGARATPAPARRAAGTDDSTAGPPRSRADIVREIRDLLGRLGDPAEGGAEAEAIRWVLRWSIGADGYEGPLGAAPAHSAYLVARLARSYADRLTEIATQLDDN
jgi:ParB-like chromosome segregation protein Spo0J